MPSTMLLGKDKLVVDQQFTHLPKFWLLEEAGKNKKKMVEADVDAAADAGGV